MMDRVVQVPSALLLDRDVPATARLLWMVAQLRPEAGVTELSQMSGLSRTTIYAGIYQLAARGWDPKAGLAPGASGRTARTAVPTPGLTDPTRGATIPVPAALLTDHRLQPFSRILYGLLLLTPGYCHPRGRFTYEQLAGLAHASRNSVASAVGQLTRAEWICAERAHRLVPISFELTFPGLSRGLAALDAAQERLSRADPYGEGIMREYLSLLIDSENYEDNAEPGFLLRPSTGALLQFDRYYPKSIAFEFNGAQHYRATKRYTAEQSAEQRERDYIKMGICVERGITLVIIRPEDLSLNGMRQKVGHPLPLRDLTGYDLLVDYLESESRDYIRRVSRI